MARSWTTPGVLLLGAVAHPMSPVRAQGIGLALRDVIVAANHLRPLAERPAEPATVDRACAAVPAEREPEIRRAQLLQRREAGGQSDMRAAIWRFVLGKRAARASAAIGGPNEPGCSGKRDCTRYRDGRPDPDQTLLTSQSGCAASRSSWAAAAARDERRSPSGISPRRTVPAAPSMVSI